MAQWRWDCMYGSIVALASQSNDKATRVWLGQWKLKFPQAGQQASGKQIDNRDDWMKLRGNKTKCCSCAT